MAVNRRAKPARALDSARAICHTASRYVVKLLLSVLSVRWGCAVLRGCLWQGGCSATSDLMACRLGRYGGCRTWPFIARLSPMCSRSWQVLAASAPKAAAAERILTRRLHEPEFAMILSATPAGEDAAARRVLREIRSYQHTERSSARNLAAMVRIALLSQIDALWWGHLPSYESDDDVRHADDLLDLDGLRRDDMVLFRYRRQATTLLARAARSAERRAAPGRVPQTAGLRFGVRASGTDRVAKPDSRRLRGPGAAGDAVALGDQSRAQRVASASSAGTSVTRRCCRAPTASGTPRTSR